MNPVRRRSSRTRLRPLEQARTCRTPSWARPGKRRSCTGPKTRTREQLAAHVKTVVESALSRVSHRITRVEVHLSDENCHKRGQDDQRCMMEARLAGRKPTAVTQHAATLDLAIDGAPARLMSSIGHTLGRLQDR